MVGAGTQMLDRYRFVRIAFTGCFQGLWRKLLRSTYVVLRVLGSENAVLPVTGSIPVNEGTPRSITNHLTCPNLCVITNTCRIASLDTIIYLQSQTSQFPTLDLY